MVSCCEVSLEYPESHGFFAALLEPPDVTHIFGAFEFFLRFHRTCVASKVYPADRLIATGLRMSGNPRLISLAYYFYAQDQDNRNARPRYGIAGNAPENDRGGHGYFPVEYEPRGA
jgi:hypothetical protein